MGLPQLLQVTGGPSVRSTPSPTREVRGAKSLAFGRLGLGSGPQRFLRIHEGCTYTFWGLGLDLRICGDRVRAEVGEVAVLPVEHLDGVDLAGLRLDRGRRWH